MNSMDIALLCKALGDANRLQIVEILSGTEEICACQLLEHFHISQPTLSHHMKVLNDCDLVRTRKEGKWNHYSVNRELLEAFGAYVSGLSEAGDEKAGVGCLG